MLPGHEQPPPVAGRPLEPVDVDVLGGDGEPVAGAVELDQVGRQVAPEPGDLAWTAFAAPAGGRVASGRTHLQRPQTAELYDVDCPASYALPEYGWV
ncbi:hypothetical protein GCM10009734_02600 [Nonomuraea bangladeshensis]